jgi:hypothetical protein
VASSVGEPSTSDATATARATEILPGDSALGEEAAQLRAAAGAGSADAETQLALVEQRAREIYLSAYFAKDDDPESARAAFRLVVATLRTEDGTARKAKRWLDKLERKSAKEE